MVKIAMPGGAGYGWQRTIESWTGGQVVELPDDNEQAVAWGRGWLEMGAELVEDTPAKQPAKQPTPEPGQVPPPTPAAPPREEGPSLADLQARAEQLGVAKSGTKDDLAKRIQQAEQRKGK